MHPRPPQLLPLHLLPLRLLQNCVRPQLNRLVHRHAFYLGQLRNRRIEQPAPLLGGDLFRG